MILFFAIAVLPMTLHAQESSSEGVNIPSRPIKLAGPRAGLTYIGGDLGKQLNEYGMTQYISQVGWQFETRYFETRDGLHEPAQPGATLDVPFAVDLRAEAQVHGRTRHGCQQTQPHQCRAHHVAHPLPDV